MDFVEFPPMHVTLGPTHDCCIVSKNANPTAVNSPMTHHYAVTRCAHPILNKHIELIEAVRIKKQINSLPGTQFSFFVLFSNLFRTTTHGSCFFNFSKSFYAFFHGFAPVRWISQQKLLGWVPPSRFLHKASC
ncbi:MAG: hypothetical protein BWX92_01437 [Deltaproteobacteria bacterium ADurb.Bin135]|nr:MAG: hypothetical protein BWX92_01437 [Deltaproteobacteria bacterium ADurb.Bin135]